MKLYVHDIIGNPEMLFEGEWRINVIGEDFEIVKVFSSENGDVLNAWVTEAEIEYMTVINMGGDPCLLIEIK